MPAHGKTGPWRGRYALADTASDLAASIRSLDLDPDTLSVLGHSWGGMVVAGLSIAGIRSRKLILLDPPYLEIDDLAALTQDPIDATVTRSRRTGDAQRHASGVVARRCRGQSACFDALRRRSRPFDSQPERAMGLRRDPARGARVLRRTIWYLRGEPRFGGLIPDHMLPQLAARVGDSHVLTIADGSHDPMRTHHQRRRRWRSTTHSPASWTGTSVTSPTSVARQQRSLPAAIRSSGGPRSLPGPAFGNVLDRFQRHTRYLDRVVPES